MISERLAVLVREKGWASLNELQLKSIEIVKRGDNVLITAPTGSGKTEAALLPVLDEMLRTTPEPVSLLYITPMRALINDVFNRIKWWADKLGLTIARKHGEVSQREKNMRNKVKPQILVLTPESLKIDLDWAPKFRENYRSVRWIVIDEVHEIAGNKRGVQLSLLLERLRKLFSIDPQIIALSATIGSPEEVLELISGSSSRRRTVLTYNGTRKSSIFVEYLDTSRFTGDEYWAKVAWKVLGEIEPITIVFVQSRYAAERLFKELSSLGLEEIAVHHSSVSGEIKEDIEDKMRKGYVKAVITTRTLELGIDIGYIKKVVVVGSPATALSLAQKVGRSGHREGEESRGVVIATSATELLESVAAADNMLEGIIEPQKPIPCPLDIIAREALGMALSGVEVTPEILASLARDSKVCRDFDEEQARRLLDFLSSRKLMKRGDKGYRLSSGFFKIWSFGKDKKWWSRDFSEFFTVISEREVFQVRHGENTIGELDSQFVYRYLRVGDTVRLAGRSWRVIDIDDNSKKISVAPAPTETSEIPVWRGLAQSVSNEVLIGVINVLRRGVSKENMLLSEEARSIIEKVREEWMRINGDEAGSKVWVHEKGDSQVIITFMGQRINEALGLLLLSALSRVTTSISLKVTPYAVMVKPKIDLGEVFGRFSCFNELKRELLRVVNRHPLYVSVLNELKYSLGAIGDKSDEEKEFVKSEASRQLLHQYMDIDGLWVMINSLRKGEIELRKLESEPPSFITEELSSTLELKPWYRDLSGALQKLLKGWAFTVEEISEALLLPARTIEHKLKEMRKPGSKARVTKFIDTETGEARWCLMDDLPGLASDGDFRESFTPLDNKQPFQLKIKADSDDAYMEFVFTPSLSVISEIINKVPFDEIYELQVQPLVNGIYRNLSPRYYFVKKSIAPYLVLNGVAYLQKIKGLE
ncbi:MAG: DEAD/DEAH box helicase [Fervidicoccaceae archaeon]|nr:DEAD/DEAH box helicase [Fervidicoccaceae archaeon]